MTNPPESLTYSSVVSHDSVRINFVIANQNGLDILAAEIGNTYLNAPFREKIYFTAGSEFGNRIGVSVVVVLALYNLRTSVSDWIAHSSETTRGMDFIPLEADPDVWMQKSTKSNLFKHWEYLLIFVDNILCVSEHLDKVTENIKNVYRLKGETSGKTHGSP